MSRDLGVLGKMAQGSGPDLSQQGREADSGSTPGWGLLPISLCKSETGRRLGSAADPVAQAGITLRLGGEPRPGQEKPPEAWGILM